MNATDLEHVWVSLNTLRSDGSIREISWDGYSRSEAVMRLDEGGKWTNVNEVKFGECSSDGSAITHIKFHDSTGRPLACVLRPGRHDMHRGETPVIFIGGMELEQHGPWGLQSGGGVAKDNNE